MAITPIGSINKELFTNAYVTYLTSDSVSNSATLTVDSIRDIAINNVLFIGKLGEEKSEIIKTHTSTAPTASVVTLLSNTTFYHPRGTSIYVIDYDQIEISHSATTTGSKSVLATIDIDPDNLETVYKDSTQTSGYYFIRYKNSITSTYSVYSDPIPYAGYGDNTVRAIKDRALEQLGEKIGDVISDEFLNNSLWEARRELDNSMDRWSWRIIRDYPLTQVIPGINTATLPTDLRSPSTNKNILMLSIGKDKSKIDYCDVNTMNQYFQGVAQTTLNGVVSDTDVTIVLTSSGDFDSSGNIDVAASSVSGTIDTITYTGNTLASNTLTGVTGIATGGHATLTKVWQNANFGRPDYYTIDAQNGNIVFNMPFDDDDAGENIYIDYYKTLPVYDSDADTLDEPEYDLFVNYLKWKIKSKKSNGRLSPKDDPDYQEWQLRKQNLITKEYLGQQVFMVPDDD